MKINLSRPDITEKEIEAVCEVLRGPNLSLGPKLPEFEQAFAGCIGTQRAVAVNSGTSGLFLCLKAMGVGEGDEVITTPFTFIASAATIMAAGARPVFADIDPVSLNISAEGIKTAVTESTRAVLPVEVFGNPAGFDRITETAAACGLDVIEDCCEALGSSLNGKKAGTYGRAGVFAFYPNKQITTGEGGMILTDDHEIADLCVSMRNQGRSAEGGWLNHVRMGYNYRLSDINCALGIVQLSRLEEIKAKRAAVAAYYQDRLIDDKRLTVPFEAEGCDLSWFVFVVRLAEGYGIQDRDRILEYMRNEGIAVSNYFSPVHLQPFIAEKYGFKGGEFPVTESVSSRTIALPFYNNLTESEVGQVCETLKKALDETQD